MDSKLLGSNIAWYSRYGIVHETIRFFYHRNEGAIQDKLKVLEQKALKGIYDEKGSVVTYRSTKEGVEKKFTELGVPGCSLRGMSCVSPSSLIFGGDSSYK